MAHEVLEKSPTLERATGEAGPSGESQVLLEPKGKGGWGRGEEKFREEAEDTVGSAAIAGSRGPSGKDG